MTIFSPLPQSEGNLYRRLSTSFGLNQHRNCEVDQDPVSQQEKGDSGDRLSARMSKNLAAADQARSEVRRIYRQFASILQVRRFP